MATVAFGRRAAPLPADKPLPQNKDAERFVLGAILHDDSNPNATLKLAAEKLTSSDFSVAEYATIFRRMMAMHEKKLPIDLGILSDELQNSGELAGIPGGAVTLAGLMDGVPRVSNVGEYARIVREKSVLRQLIHKTHDLQEMAFEGSANSAALLTELDAFSRSAAHGRAAGLIAADVRDFLLMPLDELEYVIEPLLTMKGRGMIYSARGAGKTYVTMQIAQAIATGKQSCFVWNIPKARPVVYVDGEMHAAMLQERQRGILKMNDGAVPEPGFLRLITRDLQKDSRPKINSKTGRDQIEAHLSKGDVLILDNLSALSPSSDEKETEDWAITEDWLSDLSWHGITTMFVNHAGKSGDQRGTSKREDLLDFVLKLRVPSDHSLDEGLRAEMHLTKLRGISPQAKWGQPFEVRLGIDEYGATTWISNPLRELLRDRARQMLADGMKTNDVVLETGMTRWAVARIQRGLKWGPTAENGGSREPRDQ